MTCFPSRRRLSISPSGQAALRRRDALAILGSAGLGLAGALPRSALAQPGSHGQPVYRVRHMYGEKSDHREGGSHPGAAPILASDGHLYGTCSGGGTRDMGTIYRIQSEPRWDTHFVTLFRFHSAAGMAPGSELLQAADGLLYGTTIWGGLGWHDYGTVFRFALDGTFEHLHRFNGTDGRFVETPLVQADDGNLYGTTSFGGKDDVGTIYRVNPANGRVRSICSFNKKVISGPISGLIQARDGLLYGTSYDLNGTGTVFRSTLDGHVSVVHAFSNRPDGANPFAELVEAPDGAFYGTTQHGGRYGGGTIFRMTPDGEVAVLHDFPHDGANHPGTALTLASDGRLYGTTLSSAFRITLDGRFETLQEGIPSTGGRLVEIQDGVLLGATAYGGDFNGGILYELRKAPAKD